MTIFGLMLPIKQYWKFYFSRGKCLICNKCIFEEKVLSKGLNFVVSLKPPVLNVVFLVESLRTSSCGRRISLRYKAC